MEQDNSIRFYRSLLQQLKKLGYGADNPLDSCFTGPPARIADYQDVFAEDLKSNSPHRKTASKKQKG